MIGFTTRATLNRLLEAGDITPLQVQRFQQAAVAFLERAVEYAVKKLPIKEPLLKHAMFLDVQQRAECSVEDALYFVDRLVAVSSKVHFIHCAKAQHKLQYLNMLYKLSRLKTRLWSHFLV